MTTQKNYTLRDQDFGAIGGNLIVGAPINQDTAVFVTGANGLAEFVAVGGIAQFSVPPIGRGKITQVTCRVNPTLSHAGFVFSLPKLKLLGWDVTGTQVVNQEVTDPSANLVAYEITHLITLPITDADAVMSATNFVVVITNEGATLATDAQALTVFDLIFCTITPEY